ncbi:MAG TPA: hypothetical protein VHF90_02170 [Thermoleophilaceae bacterium]|nr:hypothetical protein [Thermoleophilaceae bacterium]
MRAKTRIAATALIVVVLVGALAVVALAQDGDANAPAPSKADVVVPVSGPIESALGAFRQPRDAAADRLPAIAASEVDAIAPDGTLPEASVKAQGNPAAELYLTPAPGGVCLSLVGAAGATVNCVPREGIEQGSGDPSPSMLMTGCTLPQGDASTPICEGATLYGVVPDGVTQVSLDVPGGPAAKVVDNSYLLDVPADLASAAVLYD